MHKAKDLTGQRFGKLTAVRPTEKKSGTCIVWECLCDCGNIAFVSGNNLQTGNTKSCGCLRNALDLAGQRFGKLTATRPTEARKGHSVVWECVCDCGNIAFVSGHNLQTGHTKSCGCLRKTKTAQKQPPDITGQRFGKLTAVRPTGERQGGKIVWECLCDCGNTAFVSVNNLRTGNTKSCGCLTNALDLAGQRFGKITAVRPTEERAGTYIVWECLCDCGNTAFVSVNNLRSGNTKSCGCSTTALDLVGQRFGKLTAVRPTGERQGGKIVWECVCDCGNTVLVKSNNLQSGNTKSCGCLRKTRTEQKR